MKNTKERGWTHMTQIKNFVYGSATALLAVPALVSAQFKVPDGTDLPTGNGAGVLGIAGSIMKWLLTLVGILAVIAFVIAGILYLTAAGDEGQIDRAKKTMTSAIIGIIVALLGLIVLNAVVKMLSAETDF